MNKEDAHIVIAMANHNMNVTDVARAIFAHRNTVLYHLDKVIKVIKVSVFAKTFFKLACFEKLFFVF